MNELGRIFTQGVSLPSLTAIGAVSGSVATGLSQVKIIN